MVHAQTVPSCHLTVRLKNRQPEPGPDDEMPPSLIQPTPQEHLHAVSIEAVLNVAHHAVTELGQCEIFVMRFLVPEVRLLTVRREIVFEYFRVGHALLQPELTLYEQRGNVHAQTDGRRKDCDARKTLFHGRLVRGRCCGIVSRNSASLWIEFRYEYSSASKSI